MKFKILLLLFIFTHKGFSLSSGDISIKMISGYFWMDNSCSAAGPKGKVVTFRIKNTKGSLLQGIYLELGSIGFTATGGQSYSSGTPSYSCRTSKIVYVGNIAAGDSATVFYFVGYNCLAYPNGTNVSSDYLTFPTTAKDINSGSVTNNFNTNNYVIRNSNNNTITVLATTANLVGTLLTISVAYNISNVKPGNIIDMQLSTTNTFPAGYSIKGCKITASSIPSDFPVNSLNTHYSNSIVTNSPSGGTVTIEWYLKITGTISGISSTNIIPYVVSDAGSSQRWQANTTAFTGTSVPANSLSVTKRVNLTSLQPNDTVTYTIVIKNSSTLYDVSIEKLVDNLPRDYQFLHMETDTNIYSKLVTYSNCTFYPTFQDTNLLNFIGMKQLGAGVFSWVIPKNDSFKLIYSSMVSADPGINDTNFVSIYIESIPIDTAFAVTNVLSPLPLGIIDFELEGNEEGIQLSWTSIDQNEISHFNIYRQSAEDDAFIKTEEVAYSQNNHYIITDYDANKLNSKYYGYKLEQVNTDGATSEYFQYIDMSQINEEIKFKINRTHLIFGNISNAIKTMHVSLTDIDGKTISDDILSRTDSDFILPYNYSEIAGKCFILKAEIGSEIMVKKVVIQ